MNKTQSMERNLTMVMDFYELTMSNGYFLDQDKDTRKLRLGCRPLAAPKTYCPYIYAADVVG